MLFRSEWEYLSGNRKTAADLGKGKEDVSGLKKSQAELGGRRNNIFEFNIHDTIYLVCLRGYERRRAEMHLITVEKRAFWTIFWVGAMGIRCGRSLPALGGTVFDWGSMCVSLLILVDVGCCLARQVRGLFVTCDMSDCQVSITNHLNNCCTVCRDIGTFVMCFVR